MVRKVSFDREQQANIGEQTGAVGEQTGALVSTLAASVETGDGQTAVQTGASNEQTACRKTLVEQQDEATGDIAKQADAKIKQLDKVTTKMKQNRVNAAAGTEKMVEDQRMISEEMGRIEHRMQQCVTRLETRKKRRAFLQEELTKAMNIIGGFVNLSKQNGLTCSLAGTHLRKRIAGTTLQASKGYSTKPGSTYTNEMRKQEQSNAKGKRTTKPSRPSSGGTKQGFQNRNRNVVGASQKEAGGEVRPGNAPT
jgi:hypothetical protein